MWADLWTQNHYKKNCFSLTLSWRRSLSYRNQSTDLQSKLGTYGEMSFALMVKKKLKWIKANSNIFFWISLDFCDRFRLNVQCVAFNRRHSFETLRSLMSWDGKKHKKASPFHTTDGKFRTKFHRIYGKSHNTYITIWHSLLNRLTAFRQQNITACLFTSPCPLKMRNWDYANSSSSFGLLIAG